jgi:streptogramin lyase
MNVRTWAPSVLAIGTLATLAAIVPTGPGASVSAQADAALSGQVRGQGGAMEGVLVRARRDGSNKTLTVVTNASGAYAFPRERLEPGRYDVSIRAVGHVLAKPVAVDVAASKPARLDLTLRASNALELAYQLTDPEWLASYPLDDETKWEVFRDCSRCHTLQRPSMSTYNAEQLAWVMKRMVYSAGSSPMTFQLPGEQTPTWGRAEWGEPSAAHRRQAEAVAAINLSRGMWSYDLKTLPRPKGKETQVVYTTWDLPATARPHDTRIGKDGLIYFNHFNDNAIGRLDPRTGETKQWRWPYRGKEGSFQPTGARTLMGPDAKGRFYIGNQAQGGLVVFDPATETFRYANPPGGGEMMDVSASHVDNHGWRVGGGAVYRINLDTLEPTTTVKGPRPLVAYDIAADSQNNLYGSARNSQYVWRVDAKTMQVTYYDIPAKPRGVGGGGGGMRRGITDGRNRLWWGGYDGNFIGMVDPRQPAGKELTLYPVPFPWFFPYDAHHDNVRYTWTGGIYADRVARMNVETGEWLFYLLPFEANIRDIDLQPARDGKLSGLLFGHTHQARITLVEPLAE